MSQRPLILYVPGLLPKPEPQAHHDALQRCLLTGIRRIDGDVAAAIERRSAFDIISWTFDFYGEHRDFGLDSKAVVDVIEQHGATRLDKREASSWRRRCARWLFTIGDYLPFLIPHVANERMELHLRDLLRYTRNSNDIAEHTRQMLKMPLRAAADCGRPILLIAHSMGSVIAYEALWQLSHDDRPIVPVELLLTMGSPLGQRFIQRRLLGSKETGVRRYPRYIGRWINLSAVGDLTSIDPYIADDFAAMRELGLVDSIEDHRVHNYYRVDGELNVHAEYGYLVNAVTARIVTDWWRSL